MPTENRHFPFPLGLSACEMSSAISDRERFNKGIRPYVTEIRIGIQGIAFDRLEIDAWADDYIQRNGRRPKVDLEDEICQNKTVCQVYASEAASDDF